VKPLTQHSRRVLPVLVALVLIVAVTAIAACGSGLAGTYVRVEDPEQKVVIDSDGTYTVVWPSVLGEQRLHGTYEVDGNSIAFTLDGEGEGRMATTLGRLEEDRLVVDGVEWHGEELPDAQEAVYVRE